MAASPDVSARNDQSGQLPRIARGPLFVLAAWAAIILGLGLVGGGTGHLFGVVSGALEDHKPYDLRMVFLLATGGILIYAGVVNVGVSRFIRRGQSWALAVAGTTTISLMVFLFLLLPLPDAGGSTKGFLVFNSIYLFLLILAWIRRGKRVVVVEAGSS